VGTLSEEQCPCGRHFPVLKAIVGRCDDFLVMPSGRLIDPQTVVFQIETIPEVREFRVVQQEDGRLTVTIVPETAVDFRSIREKIDLKLKDLFNGALCVDVVEAGALDRGSTGKHRSIISRTSREDRAPAGCRPCGDTNAG
jgi:phenylacetate-CoA ligase